MGYGLSRGEEADSFIQSTEHVMCAAEMEVSIGRRGRYRRLG